MRAARFTSSVAFLRSVGTGAAGRTMFPWARVTPREKPAPVETDRFRCLSCRMAYRSATVSRSCPRCGHAAEKVLT